jgi:hypothetical protein
MTKNQRRSIPKEKPPRPEPFNIPEGTPILKCPPGRAHGRLQRKIKVSVTCERCSHVTELECTKRQLRHIRGKCERCNSIISLRWNVRAS